MFRNTVISSKSIRLFKLSVQKKFIIRFFCCCSVMFGRKAFKNHACQNMSPKGGRPRIPDRAALTGILFVLNRGKTCWRRLRDCQEAGIGESLHHTILPNLHNTKKIDWSRACIDSSVVQTKGGSNSQDSIP